MGRNTFGTHPPLLKKVFEFLLTEKKFLAKEKTTPFPSLNPMPSILGITQ